MHFAPTKGTFFLNQSATDLRHHRFVSRDLIIVNTNGTLIFSLVLLQDPLVNHHFNVSIFDKSYKYPSILHIRIIKY